MVKVSKLGIGLLGLARRGPSIRQRRRLDVELAQAIIVGHWAGFFYHLLATSLRCRLSIFPLTIDALTTRVARRQSVLGHVGRRNGDRQSPPSKSRTDDDLSVKALERLLQW